MSTTLSLRRSSYQNIGSVRDDIVNGRTSFRASKNKWDWLGSGMCFWQNNYNRALDYAKNPPPSSSISTPAVLGAVFNLGNCLDLLDKAGIELVQGSFENLKQSALREGTRLPSNANPSGSSDSNDKILRRLDCAVINNIHKVAADARETAFDSMRGFFLEGTALYHGAGFLDKTHIQICIRNPNLIKGFFYSSRIHFLKFFKLLIKPANTLYKSRILYYRSTCTFKSVFVLFGAWFFWGSYMNACWHFLVSIYLN